MHKLTLLILALLILTPSTGQAQAPKPVGIAPCLPADGTLIRLDGTAEFGETWRQALKSNTAFYALAGAYIPWLGYASKGHESEEWYGITAGFGGVNMMLYGDAFLISIFNADKQMVGRIEVREYFATDDYLLFFTTLKPFGLPDGTRYDYHIPADPRRNGEACMFRIKAKDFNHALGWQ